jgi:hypothetical protein
MKRYLAIAGAAVLVAACSTASGPDGGGSTPAPGAATQAGGAPAPTSGDAGGGGGGGGGGGAGGAGVADAAAAVKDVCTVMPKDTIRGLVPDAADPVTDAAYHQCTMSNGTTAVQITLSGGFGEPDPPVPADTVGGVGEKAWIQEQFVDDAYLVIFLGTTATQSYQTLYVEWAGHDGKAHRDDAIAVAKATIQALQ